MVRLSALGDVLMAVPLVRTIQTHLPQVKLSWVISRPAFDLVEGMDGVEFILIDKPNNPVDYWRFKKQMSSQVFDVLLAPQASFRTNLLYPLIRANRKIGYDSLRAKDFHGWFVKERIAPGSEHTLEGFLKFAEPLGIKEKVIRWDLSISPDDYKWAKDHLPEQGPILVVNPAASKPERSWLVERYIDVLKQAQKRWQAQIVITGGPGEFDKWFAEQIMQEITATNLAGKTKPKQLLAVISLAKAVLCPDTGPSHMSAAVNTPVIALHAVTSPAVSGPYIFQHLAVNRYPEACKEVLGLASDQTVWGTHVHGDKAMQLITVDAVMEKLAEVFG